MDEDNGLIDFSRARARARAPLESGIDRKSEKKDGWDRSKDVRFVLALVFILIDIAIILRLAINVTRLLY